MSLLAMEKGKKPVQGGADQAFTPERVANAFRSGGSSELGSLSDLSACMMPLLVALGFKGSNRKVSEALPHFADDLDVVSFRNVMANLNYRSRPLNTRMGDVDGRLMPCLFVPRDPSRSSMVLLGRDENGLRLYDGASKAFKVGSAENIAGKAYLFSEVEPEDERQARLSENSWVRSITDRFRPLFAQAIVITFILYVLALAVPLFIMGVYDRVIATGALDTLWYLLGGVGVALVCDMMMRSLRARIMAYVGARLDNIIGVAIFEHILHLPAALIERATIGAQVARLKDFESVREFFAGPLAMVLIEFPFVLVLVFVIALLGGPLAFIPLVMVAIFGVIAWIMAPIVRKQVSETAQAASKRQEFLVEMVGNIGALKYSYAEETWLSRYRDLSADLAMANYHSSRLNALVQTIGHVVLISSGIAVLASGTHRVLEADMTIGALVAIMIMVWRVLAPIQTAFVTLGRITQVRSSIRQIDNLMRIRAEKQPRSHTAPLEDFKGRVTFNRVSMRYSSEADPALVGVAFDVRPGELVAVIGRNGAGKSTLLKLVDGLYAPQGGNVRIDGVDIRQMDTHGLRHSIGYVPQELHLFFGTIAQNLRLADPTASDEQVILALKRARAWDDIQQLPKGVETRVGDRRSGLLPSGLQQRIMLARTILRESKIMLFDESVDALDRQGDEAFVDIVKNMRGRSTIFMVTHRPSHMKMADRLLVLDSGHLVFNGDPAEGLAKLPKDFL